MVNLFVKVSVVQPFKYLKFSPGPINSIYPFSHLTLYLQHFPHGFIYYFSIFIVDQELNQLRNKFFLREVP